jgi:hypothetical protein
MAKKPSPLRDGGLIQGASPWYCAIARWLFPKSCKLKGLNLEIRGQDLPIEVMGSWAEDFPFHSFDNMADDPRKIPEFALDYMRPNSSICFQLDEQANYAVVGWRFHTRAELMACLADHPELPLLKFSRN